jgi:hypothetical protein
MMNRTAMGLAIGAGYLLGRTRKLKMALAVGGLVAGKKLNLTPSGVADLLGKQLRDNPQFKEIGDQLREDLRGVGKAASGAMVERQMTALADRLHGRTSEVREQLTGAAGLTGGHDDEQPDDERAEDEEFEDAHEEEPEGDEGGDDEGGDGGEERSGGGKTAGRARARKAVRRAPAEKTARSAGKSAGGTAGKQAAKAGEKTARKAPAKKTAGRAGAAAKKSAPGRKAAARQSSRARSASAEGGEE